MFYIVKKRKPSLKSFYEKCLGMHEGTYIFADEKKKKKKSKKKETIIVIEDFYLF